MTSTVALTEADRGVPAAGRRARTWLVIPCTLAAGAVWGTVARLWMRWVSTDPEFSWAGTVMIIVAFSIFGMASGVAAVLRSRRCRRWVLTVGRLGGIVGTMPLFVGAGGLMLPTVIAGGLAAWRRDWPRWLRALAGIVGCLPVLAIASSLVKDFGVLGGAARTCGVTIIYGVVVAATAASLAPQADGWRVSRWLRLLGVLGAVLVLGVASVGVVGLR